MEKVILINHLDKNPENQEFDLDHAQRMLDHGRLNPPNPWKLNDEKYQLVNGKITPISNPE